MEIHLAQWGNSWERPPVPDLRRRLVPFGMARKGADLYYRLTEFARTGPLHWRPVPCVPISREITRLVELASNPTGEGARSFRNDGCGSGAACDGRDLSGIGTGVFTIGFSINTAQTDYVVAVLAQRNDCSGANQGPGGWWSARLVGGKLSIETGGPYGADYTFTQSSVTVSDGQPHAVLVERRSGTLTITVDCAVVGTGPHSAAFGALSTSGVEPCVGADGAVALTGTLSNVCIKAN